MTQATPYTRTTGFAADERDNVGGRSTVATADVDFELDAISVAVNQTIANLTLLQRDDGVMRDSIVPASALGSDTLKLLTTGTSVVRGAWVTATLYTAKDLVVQSGNTYICAVTHTSGTFATDLAAIKWILFQIGSNPAAGAIPFTPTANVLSTNLQAAVAEVDTNWRASIAAYAASLLTNTGAALMNMLPAGVGTAIRSVLSILSDQVYIKNFSGIDTTGGTSSAAGFQAALTSTRLNGGPINAGKELVITAGTYKIDVGLVIGSGQRVRFEPGVVIDASGLPDENTSLFTIAAQTGVVLEGNGCLLKGARASANAAIEGTSAAIYLYGAKSFEVSNFRIQDFATDGITVTGDNSGSGPCENGVIRNCVASNNRRNGISVISARGVTVIGGEYKGSNGAPHGPFAGVDIEPNANCFIQAVALLNVKTSGNAGAGIQIVPMSLGSAGAASNTFSVTINGGQSFNDGTVNTVNKPGLLFTAGGVATNQVFGQIEVNGFVVDSPADRGVAFYNWDADKSPPVVMNDCAVFDPDYTLSGSGNDNRTGIVISADATQAITNLGNITMRNCRVVDRRASPRMVKGFELGTVAGKTLKNILIIDPSSTNFTGSVKADVYADAALISGGMLNVDVVYTTRRTVSIGGSQDISRFMGQRILATVSENLTLPAAVNCPGAHYEFETDVGIASVSLLPVAGDTIGWLVDVASTNLVLDANAVVSLRSRGGTSWVVEEVNGKTRVAGNSTPGQTFWTTAIPSTGTHSQGDRALMKTSAVGSPKQWDCTVTGSPGTWVSEGNL